MKKIPTTILLATLAACGVGGGGTEGTSSPADSTASSQKSWGLAGPLESSDTEDAFPPQLAMNAAGDAVAIWTQTKGDTATLWARCLTNGTWSAPTPIASSEFIFDAKIAVAPDGHAIAVWMQKHLSSGGVYSNRYGTSTGWEGATHVGFDSGDESNPDVAMDGQGNAVVVWNRHDGYNTNTSATRFAAEAKTWSAPEKISLLYYVHSRAPRIAMNTAGQAIVVWADTEYHLWSRRYDSLSGWGASAVVSFTVGDGPFPRAAIDAQGNALVVWREWDGVEESLYSRSYPANAPDGARQFVEMLNGGTPYNLELAMDPAGHAFAVWYQTIGNIQNVCTNRFDPAAGWGTAFQIDESPLYSSHPHVTADSKGSAMVAWHGSDGSANRVFSRRYDALAGWENVQLVETGPQGGGFMPRVGVDDGGNALVVWGHSTLAAPKFNVWFNRFQ